MRTQLPAPIPLNAIALVLLAGWKRPRFILSIYYPCIHFGDRLECWGDRLDQER